MGSLVGDFRDGSHIVIPRQSKGGFGCLWIRLSRESFLASNVELKDMTQTSIRGCLGMRQP